MKETFSGRHLTFIIGTSKEKLLTMHMNIILNGQLVHENLPK